MENKVNQNSIKQTFQVTGLSCTSCANSVASMLKKTKGVEDAGVDFATQMAWVVYDSSLASAQDFKQAIQSIGYDLLIDTENV